MTDNDDRVTCTTCANLRAGHCTQAERAGLTHKWGKAEIGPELAQLPQRCPAYRPRQEQKQ